LLPNIGHREIWARAGSTSEFYCSLEAVVILFANGMANRARLDVGLPLFKYQWRLDSSMGYGGGLFLMDWKNRRFMCYWAMAYCLLICAKFGKLR